LRPTQLKKKDYKDTNIKTSTPPVAENMAERLIQDLIPPPRFDKTSTVESAFRNFNSQDTVLTWGGAKAY